MNDIELADLLRTPSFPEHWAEHWQQKPHQEVETVKPTHLFRYDGGYRIGRNMKPKRVKVLAKKKLIEIYRGAHP